MRSVFRILFLTVFGRKRIASGWSRGKGTVFLLIPLLTFLISSLTFLLLTLTLGEGILVFCDFKLRVKTSDPTHYTTAESRRLHMIIASGQTASSYPNHRPSDTGLRKSEFERSFKAVTLQKAKSPHFCRKRAPITVFTTVKSMLLLGIRLFYVLFDFLVLLVVLLAVVTFAHGILLWICWPV